MMIFNVDINGEVWRIIVLMGTAALALGLITLDWIVSSRD